MGNCQNTATHDYDAITRAIKELPLGKQLRIIRGIVQAKDFQPFTCDATNAIDFALDDMDAQSIEMLREDDIAIHGAEA